MVPGAYGESSAMSETGRQYRPPVQRQRIYSILRDQIVQGHFAPGARLPSFAELERAMGVAEATVERALRRLEVDGFVRIKSKVGTFVADYPPHLCRYGLIFHDHEVQEFHVGWSRFYGALRIAAERFNAMGDPREVHCYYDCSGHADSEGYQELLRDLEGRRLAGLLFSSIPDHALSGQPPMEMPGIARVAMNTNTRGIPVVGIDAFQFIDKALDRLAARGRKRIAMITTHTTLPVVLDYFRDGLLRRGMMSLPYWIYPVTWGIPLWVHHAVYAVMRSGDLPPDGMILTDDHLVEYVDQSFAELGIRVPEELEVITHWNYPLDDLPRAPMTRLGHDAEHLLSRWIETIDVQHTAGAVIPARELLAPLFEEEYLSARNSTAETRQASII
jgi:DNA-binding transcriptional regulator YhcF (GntR family)